METTNDTDEELKMNLPNTPDAMATQARVTAAIQESIANNVIARIYDPTPEEALALCLLCDDCADDSPTQEREYWGGSRDEEWRVHLPPMRLRSRDY